MLQSVAMCCSVLQCVSHTSQPHRPALLTLPLPIFKHEKRPTCIKTDLHPHTKVTHIHLPKKRKETSIHVQKRPTYSLKYLTSASTRAIESPFAIFQKSKETHMHQNRPISAYKRDSHTLSRTSPPHRPAVAAFHSRLFLPLRCPPPPSPPPHPPPPHTSPAVSSTRGGG